MLDFKFYPPVLHVGRLFRRGAVLVRLVRVGLTCGGLTRDGLTCGGLAQSWLAVVEVLGLENRGALTFDVVGQLGDFVARLNRLVSHHQVEE